MPEQMRIEIPGLMNLLQFPIKKLFLAVYFVKFGQFCLDPPLQLTLTQRFSRSDIVVDWVTGYGPGGG